MSNIAPLSVGVYDTVYTPDYDWLWPIIADYWRLLLDYAVPGALSCPEMRNPGILQNSRIPSDLGNVQSGAPVRFNFSKCGNRACLPKPLPTAARFSHFTSQSHALQTVHPDRIDPGLWILEFDGMFLQKWHYFLMYIIIELFPITFNTELFPICV